MHREQSKGPNTLPCGTPYSNKLGCDLTSGVTTTWDRQVLERNEVSKLRAVDETPNQCFKRLRILWSIVSKVAERSSSSAVERPASKQKYHFEHAREQFHKNEIYDMQTENLTWDYERIDAAKDDQQYHVK